MIVGVWVEEGALEENKVNSAVLSWTKEGGNHARLKADIINALDFAKSNMF